jgi:hypothetical protein
MLYLFSMFVYPWVHSHGDWTHVQSVWDKWQSLNVGMLAFLSSVIAFNISRFNANKQRERDFLASKAFLPAALSELTAYFKSSASILVNGWESIEGPRPEIEAPKLPDDYKSIFGQCIRYASPDVGDYLSRILVRLQVHSARLLEFVRQSIDVYVNHDNYFQSHALYRYKFRMGDSTCRKRWTMQRAGECERDVFC